MPPKKNPSQQNVGDNKSVRKSVASKKGNMSRKGSGESKGQADAKSAKLSQKSASRYEETGEADAAEVASVIQANNDQNAQEELKVDPAEQVQELNAQEELKEDATYKQNEGNQGEPVAEFELAQTQSEIPQPEQDLENDPVVPNNEEKAATEHDGPVENAEMEEVLKDVENVQVAQEVQDPGDEGMPRTIRLVEESWSKVVALGLQDVGIIFFKNVFTIAPEALQLFPFKDEPNLYESLALKKHALNVMNAVGKAVDGLNDLEALVPILAGLGKRHVGYGVKKEHYPIIGQALIDTLKAGLADSWNDELLKSWSDVYTIVKDTMIGDHYSESNKTPEQQVDFTKPQGGSKDDLDADLADIGAQSGNDYTQSVDTKGLNLGENIDDAVNKSMAMTEMMKPPGTDDKLFDKNNEKFEKYTDINEDQVELKDDDQMDLDNLGFMDEDIDFQPTELQKNIKMVKQSWAQFEMLGLDKCGQAFFRNIFKIAPTTILLFPFKDEPKIYQSEMFKAHALKAISAVDMAVKSLDDLESLMPKLKNLGRIHVKKGVKVEHYPVVGDALITTMRVGIKKSWTPEIEKAWEAIYQIIQDTMIGDNYEPNDPEDIELTDERVQLVQECWKSLIVSEETYLPVGIATLKEFFKLQPEAKAYFNFGNTEQDDNSVNENQIYEQIEVHEQTTQVMRTFDTVINSLDDFMAIEDTLKQQGKSNFAREVTEAHYAVMGTAILNVLEETLQHEWNAKLKKALICTWIKLSNTMKGDHYGIQFPHANSETAFDDTVRNDDSMRGLMNGDGESITGIPIRKKSSGLEDGKDNNRNKDDANMRDHYLKRFRKEVDFHHKVAYRFEKAYRLGKKMSEKKQSLNLDIIDCISEHSGYIEQDPMALFYCLFFCVYYKNEELVEFLRSLIQKIYRHDKIDKLLEYIDVNGIERIRTVGEQINSIVYHMIFYQAIDDDLRIVYSQIFRQLRFIQMRDKDALQFLNQRDYELIRLSFQKNTTKLALTLFFDKAFPMKSSSYRKYNQAYYEEIVINNDVEQRVAQNYRERFLITAEDIYIVFQMYCKEDYDEQFQQTQKDEITHQQFIDLFVICIKSDSFRIGVLIYQLYLQPQIDFDHKMLNILMSSIKDSVYYHEMKLFFLHEHFDVLSIAQLNQIVDIYQDILHHKDSKMNPIVNQFNTIKISMLIYRICFKIEEKQIYSLITKCSLLKSYLINGLVSYFEKQNNILVLYKLMSEPILHSTEKKDSLDIMYEMNMQELLRDPVVVEVLNLVYEGKFSVSSSALSMSQTFFCLLEMDTTDQKSINDRLIQNITNFGDSGSAKQTALQYHIWKQSIQRRETDEMAFIVLINTIIIGMAIYLNIIFNNSYNFVKENFGGSFNGRVSILINAKTNVLENFCQTEIDNLLIESDFVKLFYMVMIITAVGMVTSIFQKIVHFIYKDNVTLNITHMVLEFSICITSVLFIWMYSNKNLNPLITDVCSPFVELDAETSKIIDHMYTLTNPRAGELDFKLIISIIVIQSCAISIMMLQRTAYLGELIIMLTQMQAEILKFFLTFGILIIMFVFIGRFLNAEIKTESSSYLQIILDLFNALNGNQEFDNFTQPIGQTYIGVFMYLFKVLFMSLLAAMFINKYKIVWRNLDAYRRFDIIKAKNSISYDKFIGGITMTFFPINILMLPFAAPILAIRNPRASDFLLKGQYVIMMITYSFISGVVIIPATPILYIKSISNAIYIVLSNQTQDYKGQNVIKLVFSILLGPIVIALSLVVDLITLPNILLKDSTDFEHKYQLSTDRLNDVQIDVVMQTFAKIFYGANFEKFKGSHMTLYELMVMHTGIFSIIDNLHELFCRGSKNSKEALANVQDYNMTKILTRKCSIPDKSGDYKQGRCELNVIHAVQMDIEMYNYWDIVMRKMRMGILRQDIANKEMKSKKGEVDAEEEVKVQDLDEEDDETKKIDGIHAILIGPDGVPLKRNNSDVMNNFYIQIIVKAYTEIDAQLAELLQNSNKARERKMEKFLETTRDKWKSMTEGQFQHYSAKFIGNVKSDLGIKTQHTIGSTNHSDPQNNQNSMTLDKSKGSTDGKETKEGLEGEETMNKKSKTTKSMQQTNKKKGKKEGKVAKSKTEK